VRVKLSKRQMHQIQKERSKQNLRRRVRRLCANEGLLLASFSLISDSVKGPGMVVKRVL